MISIIKFSSGLSFLLTVFIFDAAVAAQLPTQSSSRRPRVAEPPLDLPIAEAKLAHQPDRSLQVVWVRMFPIVTVPLSDPYPTTVNINDVGFECSGEMEVYSLATGDLLGKTKTLLMDFSKSTFRVGSNSFPVQALSIIPQASSTTLRWDRGLVGEVGVKLRGQFVIRQTVFESDSIGKPKVLGQNLWSVINVVDVDDYIRSVVPSEVISSWANETLKAQAIAARTYGIYEVTEARSRSSTWDVDPTTWFQSYRGTEFWDRVAKRWLKVEYANTTAAVNATDGEILTYNGKIIKAYFSANSGGQTCTTVECFALPDQPYLREVDDAPGIKDVPGGTWGTKANLTAKSIYDRLVEIGITPKSTVDRLEASVKGSSGRIWKLRVHLRSGPPIELEDLDTRKMMRLYGPIRSFLYTLGDVQPDGRQSIVGHGYGHGVGLSQWGAQLYALAGWDAYRILKYYYKGVEVSKL